ncbi:MAG: hypothetical protein DELT_03127 [Desulfovibrio sp.]
MRRSASTRNRPTPTATATMRTIFGTEGTWSASTCKSGSAMVMAMPIISATTTSSPSLRVLVSWEPIRSPIGIMAMSAPREKSAIPTIRSSAPTRKSAIVPPVMGATVKLSSKTMAVIGRTDTRASLNFAAKFLFKQNKPLRFFSFIIDSKQLHKTVCHRQLYGQYNKKRRFLQPRAAKKRITTRKKTRKNKRGRHRFPLLLSCLFYLYANLDNRQNRHPGRILPGEGNARLPAHFGQGLEYVEGKLLRVPELLRGLLGMLYIADKIPGFVCHQRKA